MTDDMNQTSSVGANSNSYVDDYSPPGLVANQSTVASSQSTPNTNQLSQFVDDYQSQPNQDPNQDQLVSDQVNTTESEVKPTADDLSSGKLEDQNIFFLLGVTDGTDEEKEAFLDELQTVIWDDFVQNDIKLLLTQDELTAFNEIMAKGKTLEIQEEMIAYLEQLIPDLEEIMLEKALELKSEMVKERINGMKEYYANQVQALSQIDHAQQLMQTNQWKQAALILNAIA